MFRIEELIRATAGKLVRRGTAAAVSGISTDTRTIRRQEAFVALKGERFDAHAFLARAVSAGAACLIVEKGCAAIPACGRRVSLIEVKDTAAALGDIAAYHRRRFSLPVIAVTGSNGKTTTKEMLAWVLGAGYRVLKNQGTQNNHVGVPLTLLQLRSAHQALVIELGSNHPGEIAGLARIAAPTMAVITNIGPSHLEFFGSLDNVREEKWSLVDALQRPAISLLNADDRLLCRCLGARQKGCILGYGIDRPCDFRGGQVRRTAGGWSFAINGRARVSLGLLGYQNIYNALAAAGCSRLLGLDYRTIGLRLRGFRAPQGRLRQFTRGKVRFIDDTYNSNPLSLRQALQTLAEIEACGRKVLVMGDMLELGERADAFHRQAGRCAARICDIFVAVGSRALVAARQAQRSGLGSGRVFVCDTAQDAADLLRRRLCLKQGDVVLAKGSRGMHLENIFARR